MIVIGFVALAVAVAAVIVVIAQNRSVLVEVHGLGYHATIHAYWLLVVGLIIAALGFFGVALMRAGAAHATRLRIERRGLVRENARLNDLAVDRPAPAPTSTSTLADEPVGAPRRRWTLHRTSHV